MANTVLNYLKGRGWMVFSGGNTPGSPIRSQALARAQAYSSVAYISTAEDGGDSMMDDMEDLGARTGYFVDLQYDSPEELRKQLEGASLIVIEVGTSVDALVQGLVDEAVSGMREAYERGAVILIEGLAANVFGRWVISDSGELLDGLNWIENAFIEPDSGGIDDSHAVQTVIERFPEAIAINIRAGAALALGADSQIEVWGDANDVTLSLGSRFTSDS